MASTTSQILERRPDFLTKPTSEDDIPDEVFNLLQKVSPIQNRSDDPKVLASDPKHICWVYTNLLSKPLKLSVCRNAGTSKKGIERTLTALTKHPTKERDPAIGDDIYDVTLEELYHHIANSRVTIYEHSFMTTELIQEWINTAYAPLRIPFKFHSEEKFFRSTKHKIHHLPE